MSIVVQDADVTSLIVAVGVKGGCGDFFVAQVSRKDIGAFHANLTGFVPSEVVFAVYVHDTNGQPRSNGPYPRFSSKDVLGLLCTDDRRAFRTTIPLGHGVRDVPCGERKHSPSVTMISNFSLSLSRISCGRAAAPEAIDLTVASCSGFIEGFLAKASTVASSVISPYLMSIYHDIMRLTGRGDEH